MVSVSRLSLAVMATVASVATADNCNTGLRYCGAGLLSKGTSARLWQTPGMWQITDWSPIGNYLPQILDELERVGLPTDRAHIYNTIFFCAGGSNGDIRYYTFCDRGCRDGGSGHDDFC